MTASARPVGSIESPGAVVAEDAQRVVNACRAELEALGGATLLLAGGSGFFGATLLDVLQAWNRSHPTRPCSVLLPTRSVERSLQRWPHLGDDPNLRWFAWDGQRVPPAQADYVIHAVGPADASSSQELQAAVAGSIVRSGRAVATWAKKAGVTRALVLSSGAVYPDPASGRPLREEDAARNAAAERPVDYAGAKRLSEATWRESSVPNVIARPFAFVGPYQDLGGGFAFVDFLRQAATTGQVTLRSDGSARRTYAYSSDLAIALVKLLVRGKPGEAYNVGSPGPAVSIRELAGLVLEAVGAPPSGIAAGTDRDPSRHWYVPDVAKIGSLCTPTVPLREGIDRTVRSMRARGVLPPGPQGAVA